MTSSDQHWYHVIHIRIRRIDDEQIAERLEKMTRIIAQ